MDMALKCLFCTIDPENMSIEHLCLTSSSVAVKKAQGSVTYGAGAQKLSPDVFRL